MIGTIQGSINREESYLLPESTVLRMIENDGQAPKGTRLAAGFHTHVLSDVPEDTDVFFVLTRRLSLPEYIGAATKKTYTIDSDGTIYEGKL
jgi:hypothetical protein